MIYGNEFVSTYNRSNTAIWLLLAFQGGVLNAGGFLGFHRFVSHVTGLGTLVGVEWGSGHAAAAATLLIVPIFFLLGAMTSGYLVDSRLKARLKPKYYIVFGWLFALLLAFTICGFNDVFGPFGASEVAPRELLALGWLCFTCGLQNGLITRASKAVIRTTHLTGLTTDLGLGLVRLMTPEFKDERSENLRATLVRAGLIASFVGGSAAGAALFLSSGFKGFLLPVAISGGLFGLSCYFQILKPRLARL